MPYSETDPFALDEGVIEAAATATRRQFGLGNGPVSNIAWLLENHGAVVSRCDLDAEPLDAFSEWRADEGVPYVVGMGCSVTDEGAFVLAKEFYSKLSDGEDPSVALALARQRVGVDLSWEDRTWLAPVLFS